MFLDRRYMCHSAALLPVEGCLLFCLLLLVPPSIPALPPGLRQRGPVHGRRYFSLLAISEAYDWYSQQYLVWQVLTVVACGP